MKNAKHEQILFYAGCLVLGTALAYAFFAVVPYYKNFFRSRQFISQTEQLALMTKTYLQTHTDYREVNASSFSEDMYPKKIYRHPNDMEFENIDGGRIQVFDASSSRYDNNMNAFTITWRDINKNDCMMLAKNNWGDLKGLRFVGMMVDKKPMQYSEEELYNGCSGGKGSKGGLVACRKGKITSVPLKKEKADRACDCFGKECQVMLMYM